MLLLHAIQAREQKQKCLEPKWRPFILLDRPPNKTENQRTKNKKEKQQTQNQDTRRGRAAARTQGERPRPFVTVRGCVMRAASRHASAACASLGGKLPLPTEVSGSGKFVVPHF